MSLFDIIRRSCLCIQDALFYNDQLAEFHHRLKKCILIVKKELLKGTVVTEIYCVYSLNILLGELATPSPANVISTVVKEKDVLILI